MPHQEKEETRIQKPGTRIIARSEGAPDGRAGVWALARVSVSAGRRIGPSGPHAQTPDTPLRDDRLLSSRAGDGCRLFQLCGQRKHHALSQGDERNQV
jgi:hypothetical protein